MNGIKKTKETNMNTITLKNGTLMYSDNYKLVETTMNEESNYAGIVASSLGTIRPYLVVLTNKPVNELSETEEEYIYDICEKECEKIKDIRENEVKSVFSDDGKLLNGYEFASSNHVGIFAVNVVLINRRKNAYGEYSK